MAALEHAASPGKHRRTVLLASRIVAAIGGGFGLTTALVALGGVALPLLFGIARGEAVLLCAMLGFIVYLVLLLWAFSEPRLARVWNVLAGGSAIAAAVAVWLAPMHATVGG